MSGRHVALLRGINVGGKNVIKMADLRRAFEAMGMRDVETHIQSGNVVFTAKRATNAALEATIERALGDAFGYAATVVVVSGAELADVIAQAPPRFGKEPARLRYDVLFVKRPLTPADALAQVPAKAGVDTVHAGAHALYFTRVIAQATQSHLSRLIQRPVYQQITVRNWNTTTKLATMAV